MSDIILKLRMLRVYGFRYLGDWYREVWLQDPDEQICCSGQMCGCYGACYYQQWEWALDPRPFFPTPSITEGDE